MKRDWYDFKAINGSIEGARANFEVLCESIFRRRYKDLSVQIIRADPGDEGIDIIIGDLYDNPTIIQCKFFIENIDESQREQIRKSFNRAINSEKYKLKRWYLCVPTTLSFKEYEWWCKWKAKQTEQYHLNENEIDLINGNKLIDLLKEYNLYNEYFDVENSLIIKENNEMLKNISKNVNVPNIERIFKETELKLKEIIRDSIIFVYHGYYRYAFKLLEKYNCCVISGSPGVGKTITAGELSLEYIRKGYNFIYLFGDFNDLINLYNPNQKQVIFIDDFLGFVSLDRNLSEKDLNEIRLIISNIIKNKNTKIIFTTREYILNQATIEYELTNRFFKFTKKCTLEFTEYHIDEKAEILYNHLLNSKRPVRALIAHSNTRGIVPYSPPMCFPCIAYTKTAIYATFSTGSLCCT